MRFSVQLFSDAHPVLLLQQFGDPATLAERQSGYGDPGHAERLLAGGLCAGCSRHRVHRHHLHVLRPPAGEYVSDATVKKLAN
jgi:hypothetical protein